MFVDIKGTTRVKMCVRDYDGAGFIPSFQRYAREGYDCVCLARKGLYIPETEGLIPSYECKTGNPNSSDGEYRILGIGVTSDPEIPEDWENMIKTSSAKAVEAIRRIHMKNGYAILRDAHKNTADEIARLEGLDAVEIRGEKDGVSELLCELSARGINLGVFCSGDGFLGGVCVETKSEDGAGIVRALKAGRYFSSEGDSEIIISSTPSGRVRVDCSPASKIQFFTDGDISPESKIQFFTDGDISPESKIQFFTNGDISPDRVYTGEDLICAEYIPRDGEKFIRAQVTSAEGLCAWSNYIEV